jgi:hypothetical protein
MNHDQEQVSAPARPPRCFTEVLDRRIQPLGYSTRRSKTIRRAVLRVIAEALARGQKVETAAGTFTTVAAPKQRVRWNPMRSVSERVYQRDRRIVFAPAAATVEVQPTRFFAEEDYRLLRRAGCDLTGPWTTDADTAAECSALLASALNPLAWRGA